MNDANKKELMNSDIKIINRRNGRSYSVRNNRKRFFYPNEWMKFYDALNNKQKISFDVLVGTGARINEAIHIKGGDLDFGRNTIILRVTKVKARKGEKNPQPRTIKVSTQLMRKLRKHVIDKNTGNEDYLGLLSAPAAHIALKKTLQRIGIKDWYMFSLHNIRKSHGTWLNAIGVQMAEICLRLGHDYNTFLKDYGSPEIFDFKDKQNIRLVLGDLYQR